MLDYDDDEGEEGDEYYDDNSAGGKGEKNAHNFPVDSSHDFSISIHFQFNCSYQ